MSIFGFPIKTPSSGGDFLPILKYDARAGRLFRMDSINTGNGWDRTPVDITGNFRALIDLTPGNVEVGWIDFASGGAPSFIMVPYPGNALPPQPGPNHKHGLRFTLKLGKECGGELPIRQIAGTSASFLNGMEALYKAYEEGVKTNPGKLPAIRLASTLPVTTGTGQRSSTNYQPQFEIVGWAPRPADMPVPVFTAPAAAAPKPNGYAVPPTTGSTRPAPVQAQQPTLADDFG